MRTSPTLVYIHGFLSSPSSYKARQTDAWLKQHRPDIAFVCPRLSPYPEETQKQLLQVVESVEDPSSLGLIGSSLGGFWSTWLVEQFGCRAVLVNPSVRPDRLVNRVLGQPQKSFHTDDVYLMTEDHGKQFQQAYCRELARHSQYWLMVQTGDETLDYRLAVERYQGCRQLVEEGGDHGFQGFEHKLPEIVNFLFPDQSL